MVDIEKLKRQHKEHLKALDKKTPVELTKTQWNKLPKALKIIDEGRKYAGVGLHQTFRRIKIKIQ